MHAFNYECKSVSSSKILAAVFAIVQISQQLNYIKKMSNYFSFRTIKIIYFDPFISDLLRKTLNQL